ncbi:MAG TPA: tetratricopeptide repeat protein [Syntrophobacteria bacterium]|nr:tetratricopeptide repeat protein [Syntrophobacteria bacterium]
MRREFFIGVILFALTATVFWQVGSHDFIAFDDPEYVIDNPMVRAGLTLQGLKWAFSTFAAANWHPLTWLSHMLDCELFGLNPGRHHLASLFFHLLNTLLLFLVLVKMTTALWRSAVVAALFAIHPLHVESVAWIAERKDVLSTSFWMLTLWAYSRYAEKPGRTSYLVALILYALGLMAKPMLVTLPFVLILLDYWPLGRWPTGGLVHEPRQHGGRVASLFREKTPFILLAALSSTVTLIAQWQGGAVSPTEIIPLGVRLCNALVAYLLYLVKMVWPVGLAVFYPHPGPSLPLWLVLLAILVLVGVTLWVLRAGTGQPYLVTGWLWYLGTLLPVIGLIQVGDQAMADRYSYIPLIGPFMMISWGLPALAARWRLPRILLPILTATALSALLCVSWVQVRHWRDSVTLFAHTLSVTTNNSRMHNNLANVLARQGKIEEALTHYEEALVIQPNAPQAQSNLGAVLVSMGRVEEGIGHYREALRLDPNLAAVHNNLGVVLAEQGKSEEALRHYLKAIELRPDYAEAHNNLGNLLADHGKLAEAVARFQEALRLQPFYPDAYNNLGVALARQDRLREAIPHFERALELQPDFEQARRNLATALQQEAQSGLPPAQP